MNKEDGARLQKQINLAQSYLNYEQGEHGGDKELMGKFAGMHIDDLNKHLLKLLNVDKAKLRAEMDKSLSWINFLEEIVENKLK